MINIDELFPTDEEKNKAKEALKMLIQTSGWQVLTHIIDKDIKIYENRLKFEDFENLEEQRECRNRHLDLLVLKDYPGQVIKALTDDMVPEVELDPYSSSEKSEKE